MRNAPAGWSDGCAADEAVSESCGGAVSHAAAASSFVVVVKMKQTRTEERCVGEEDEQAGKRKAPHAFDRLPKVEVRLRTHAKLAATRLAEVCSALAPNSALLVLSAMARAGMVAATRGGGSTAGDECSFAGKECCQEGEDESVKGKGEMSRTDDAACCGAERSGNAAERRITANAVHCNGGKAVANGLGVADDFCDMVASSIKGGRRRPVVNGAHEQSESVRRRPGRSPARRRS